MKEDEIGTYECGNSENDSHLLPDIGSFEGDSAHSVHTENKDSQAEEMKDKKNSIRSFSPNTALEVQILLGLSFHFFVAIWHLRSPDSLYALSRLHHHNHTFLTSQ
ncbi:hypothetical protein OROGR_033150 [Orobanche gracilis]